MARSSHSTTSSSPPTSALSAPLHAALEVSDAALVYVPIDEGGDVPTDEQLAALTSDGLHVEYDVVRHALAVRKATDDEVAEAAATASAASEASTSEAAPSTSS